MKLKFLGTSSGKTSAKRNHSSLFFSTENYNLLIDAGDGISRALLKNKINFISIDGIIFTHLHPDHYSGLASLIVQMKLLKRVKPLDIFIHQKLIQIIKQFLLHSYIVNERLGFEIQYKPFETENLINIYDDFSFTAKKNSHLDNLKDYTSKFNDLIPISISLLFKLRNKKIIYTSDIASEDDLLLFNEISPDIMVAEATHIPIKTLIKKLQALQSGITYLTHYSDEDESRISDILAKQFKETGIRIKIAKDGLSLKL
ncbi:MAG: MBL fold metallo-hydrolase [Ignavibacteriales bacterium]